ncbi:MAG: hypothetical protein AVDCRST_MAG11-4119, partial [uncultured Gemmatimonadaceae bacterium]
RRGGRAPARAPGAARRARAPDARDRLLPAAAGDARVRPRARLHGDAARRGELRERGARREPRVQPVGARPRHGGAAALGARARRGDQERPRRQRGPCGADPRDRGGGVPLPGGAARRDAAAPDAGDLHRQRALHGGERRAGVGPRLRPPGERRGAAERVGADEQRDARAGERAPRRPHAARLREPAAGRAERADHGAAGGAM